MQFRGMVWHSVYEYLYVREYMLFTIHLSYRSRLFDWTTYSSVQGKNTLFPKITAIVNTYDGLWIHSPRWKPSSGHYACVVMMVLEGCRNCCCADALMTLYSGGIMVILLWIRWYAHSHSAQGYSWPRSQHLCTDTQLLTHWHGTTSVTRSSRIHLSCRIILSLSCVTYPVGGQPL